MPILVEGQRFERYRVIRWLGSGVVGESYEVDNLMLQQRATLKLIHPWATLPESARRQFFREMQPICRLHHTYLADVIDYGEIDTQLYVARRYVSSGSLLGSEGRLRFHPPLSLIEVIQYGCQLAEALEYIHQQGYIHGAITLSNILVLRGPNVDHAVDHAPFLLADVGLAHFVRRFGQPKISLLPLTAAPEQLGGRAVPASDQFALAAIIYLWLAGRPPYLGSPEEIEYLKLTETIAPLSAFNPQVSIEQDEVLRRALSVYPEDRYPSIQAFASALQATLPSVSEPTSLEAALVTEYAYDIPSQTTVEQAHEPDATVEPALTPVVAEPDASVEPAMTPALAQPHIIPEQPEPFTQPAPDIPTPVPEPQHAPEPQPEPPAPEIVPPTEPVTEPEPAPEPIPQPEPDIFTPLPEPEHAPEPSVEPPQESVEETALEEALSQQLNEQTAKARLVILSPYNSTRTEAILNGDEITIGRAGSSDILLDYDDKTSRHHALLRYEDGLYVLYDRQSAHGVFVNDQRIPVEADIGCPLSNGDRISIGNYELRFFLEVPVEDYERLNA